MNNRQGSKGLFRRLVYTSMVDSIKDLYWDIRPSPHFGTIEVRVVDTPLTLDRTVNMTRLIQATAHQLFIRRPLKYQERDYPLYKSSRFQARHFGIVGIITDIDTGDGCHLSEDILRLLENIAISADKVDATSATEAIHLQAKNGYGETQNTCSFIAEGESSSGPVKKHCEVQAGL